MSTRARSLFPKRWRDAMRPDADLAEAEGLAAGTGLLTGTVARSSVHTTGTAPCPACDGKSEVVVVDLILTATTLRCVDCGRRWTVQDARHSASHS